MTLPQELRERLSERRKQIDEALGGFLPGEEGPAGRLAQAMRYSVFAGGKRLRPTLVLEACEVCGGDHGKALPAACAVEMIHTYSLVHDDLPAMDDDDLRRGRPSCHKAFDEATAILAGDGLLALAFQTAALTEPAEAAVLVVEELARASGPLGLVAGQAKDLESEDAHPELELVEFIHDHKTADLICASARVGALVARAAEWAVEALGRYGRALGRAFQITDDILDVTSTSKALGKTAGKDASASKATFPAAVGLDRSRRRAEGWVREAAAALEPIGKKANILAALAEFVLERKS